MLAPEIRVFKDIDALSRAAAAEFTEVAKQIEASGRRFTAALSGGSTPKRFYDLLGAPEFSDKIDWRRVHLFQVDERCVLPDDAESNYRMIREAMLDRIALPAANFHRMMAEQPDHEQAARRYEDDLRAMTGVPAPAWPVLDLVYLGLGSDGHTASLFPGTSALDEHQLAVRANYVPQLQMFRLTLTLPVLNAAGKVIFLASGPGKAQVVQRVLKPSAAAIQYPAQQVQPAHGRATWYLDEAAARLL